MGEMQATLDDFGIMHYCLGEFNDQAKGASQISYSLYHYILADQYTDLEGRTYIVGCAELVSRIIGYIVTAGTLQFILGLESVVVESAIQRYKGIERLTACSLL